MVGGGIVENPDGTTEGHDPRTLPEAEPRALGHEPMSAQAAIRAHCLDCCAGTPDEVRKCTAVRCPSWPCRMGRSPWKAKRVLTQAQRAAAAERLSLLNQRRKRDADHVY